MTYKLSPFLEKVESPIVVLFPDNTKAMYDSGKTVTNAVFDKAYQVASAIAVDNTIEIALTERQIASSILIGEEQTFF